MIHSMIALLFALQDERNKINTCNSPLGTIGAVIQSDYKKTLLLLAQKLNQEEILK